MPHIQSDNAICIAIRKAITKSLYLQNTYFSKKDAGVIKKYKNRKAIAVGCVKKSTRSFSLTLICQKYMAIKYSGKLFKFFFFWKTKFYKQNYYFRRRRNSNIWLWYGYFRFGKSYYIRNNMVVRYWWVCP